MSDVVIKAENLGKKYVIGHQAGAGRYVALRDVLAQNTRSLWQKTRDLAQSKPIISGDEMEEFWALKDVNFEIRRGEVVGIIGRNGAGKSTLLKVLSRITEPSTGRVTIKGRVASLLEVGTGFHPELTGRENIYLNGAILGMTRAEIRRKFDEIVDFAEVEKFLDTPVKRYSSGMYVRLAFAVAAHLEPEILLVDEVLAVGDAEFQRKCLGKMGEVAQEGRTVLFVSHNIGSLSTLCSSGIVLENGIAAIKGAIGEAIRRYTIASLPKAKLEWKGRIGDENVIVTHTWLNSRDYELPLDTALELEVGIEFEVLKKIPAAIVGLTLWSEFGYELALIHFDDICSSSAPEAFTPGIYQKKLYIPPDTLAHGTYTVEFLVGLFQQKQIVGGKFHREADLQFTLENHRGIGRQSRLSEGRGLSGLFRPSWKRE